MKNTNNIVNLVTGNIKPDNKKEILSEINTKPETKEVFKKVKIAWAVLSSTKQMQEYDVEKSYLKLKTKIDLKQTPFQARIRPVLKYAAILILILSFSVVLSYFIKQQSSPDSDTELKYTSVIAEHGQISKVILPDSSIVWLNSGTTLSYNNQYFKNNRDLILSGQAYLDVKKDINNPLTVACNDFKVKVLGTKFDVSAYPGDDKIKVVLESGSVELSHSKCSSFNYKLKPGEMAEYNTQLKNVIIKKIDTKDFTGWKEGYLIFKDSPMAEVINKLERKFNIEIVVKSPEVYKSIFNANFKDESLKEIMEYIEYSCPIKYKKITQKENLNKSIIELYSN